MSAFPLIELENNMNQPNSKDHNPEVGSSNLPSATKPSRLGLNRRLLYLKKKQHITMKRKQYEKTWIKRENYQAISPLATGFEPNPPILRQLLDDYDSQNDCF